MIVVTGVHTFMKQILGVILVIVGIAYFAFQGFSYTSREKVLDIGPIEATANQQKDVLPYSPLVGSAIIGGGIVLLALGMRSRES